MRSGGLWDIVSGRANAWSYAEANSGQEALKHVLQAAEDGDPEVAVRACGPGSPNVIEHPVLMLHR